MGDSSGGVVIGSSANDGAIIDLDGQTGATTFVASNPSNNSPSFYPNSIGQDGSIYAVDSTNGRIFKVDPTTGQSSVVYIGLGGTIPSVAAFCNSNVPSMNVLGYGHSPALLSPPIVDADGSLLFTAQTYDQSATPVCVDNGVDASVDWTTTYHYSAIKLASNGVAATTNIPIQGPLAYPNSLYTLAPDGSGGTLVNWWSGGISNLTPMMMSTSAATPYPTPLAAFYPQLVLGEDGDMYLTDGNAVVKAPPNSGSVEWTYQPTSGVNSVFSAHGGGIVMLDGQLAQIGLDATGNASDPIAISGIGSLLARSWKADWDGTTSSSVLASFEVPLIDFADGSWVAESGNLGGSDSGADMPKYALLPSCPNAQNPCAAEAVENAFGALKTLTGGACPACQTAVYSKQQLGMTKDDFVNFLAREHHFYDATRSKALVGDALCRNASSIHVT